MQKELGSNVSALDERVAAASGRLDALGALVANHGESIARREAALAQVQTLSTEQQRIGAELSSQRREYERSATLTNQRIEQLVEMINAFQQQ